jgi:NTP pyrophosphatase (non-canonical NTP hydrolase)
MKYIKIYEDFDLDKFMQDPESEFQKNEDNPEIEPGDYVTSYRGPGQVIDMDADFIKIELLDSSKKIVRVPKDLVTKTKKKDVYQDNKSHAEEIAEIGEEVRQYAEIISPDGEDPMNVNVEAIAGFIEDTLIDVLSMYKKDKNVTYLPGYDSIVNGIALIADIAETADSSISDRIQAALEKFYELG